MLSGVSDGPVGRVEVPNFAGFESSNRFPTCRLMRRNLRCVQHRPPPPSHLAFATAHR